MPHNIELLIALAVPLIVLTVLRINAAMVFMSLCLGYVLVELVAKDANSLISFLAPGESLSRTTWHLGMLLLPAILTCIFTIFSIRGRIKSALNIFPAAGASVLAVLLTVPLLTPGLRYALESEVLWRELIRAQALIVGVSAFISLLFLWSQRRHAKKSDHGR